LTDTKSFGHRSEFLRRETDQTAERFGKGPQRIISNFHTHRSDGSVRLKKQLFGALNSQASQKMMRRCAGQSIKHSDEMELAHRGDAPNFSKIKRVFQMRPHMRNDSLNSFLMSFGSVRTTVCRGWGFFLSWRIFSFKFRHFSRVD
jgi:hypothetical protein